MDMLELLQEAYENAWSLLFLSVWGLGFLLKEKVPRLSSDWIPLLLVIFGVALGMALIELSIRGALVGGLVALSQMGFYDLVNKSLTRRKT